MCAVLGKFLLKDNKYLYVNCIKILKNNNMYMCFIPIFVEENAIYLLQYFKSFKR